MLSCCRIYFDVMLYYPRARPIAIFVLTCEVSMSRELHTLEDQHARNLPQLIRKKLQRYNIMRRKFISFSLAITIANYEPQIYRACYRYGVSIGRNHRQMRRPRVVRIVPRGAIVFRGMGLSRDFGTD